VYCATMKVERLFSLVFFCIGKIGKK